MISNNSIYDLDGENKRYRGVRLVQGTIQDSGKPDGSTRTYGSLTVNRLRDGETGPTSAGQFDLRSGTVSAKLAGSGELVKNAATGSAANLVTLSGDNTYTGNTTINNGILRISHVNALGLVASGSRTIVNRDGTLQLSLAAGLSISNTESLTLRGGTLYSLSGDNTWAGNITLEDDSTIKAESAASAAATPPATNLTLSGEINVNSHNLTLEATGDDATAGRAASSITVQRPTSAGTNAIAITGAGGLVKAGSGLVTLGSRNDYTGLTDINAGELRLNVAQAIQNAPVRLANAIGARLTVKEDNTIGALSGGGANGGNIDITKGKILTVNSASNVDADTTYNGIISESDPVPADTTATAANLAKTGAGKLTLGGNNTYTGTTTISGGVLAITDRRALGTGATARVTVNTGGTLELRFLATTTNIINRLLTLNGLGATDSSGAHLGALRNVSGSNTWAGAITLGSTAAIHNANTANALTISGVISGTNFGLTKTGPGTLTLGATNTYTGVTRVEGGMLKLGGDNAINSGGSLVVAGGTFDLAGRNNTFNGVQLIDGRIDDTGLPTNSSSKGVLTLSTGNYDLKNGTVNAVLAGGTTSVGLEKNEKTGTDSPGVVTLTANQHLRRRDHHKRGHAENSERGRARQYRQRHDRKQWRHAGTRPPRRNQHRHGRKPDPERAGRA